jgi:hypothetical protein
MYFDELTDSERLLIQRMREGRSQFSTLDLLTELDDAQGEIERRQAIRRNPMATGFYDVIDQAGALGAAIGYGYVPR